jgi:hypothetical protein
MAGLTKTKKLPGAIRSIQIGAAILAVLATSSAAAPAVQDVDLKLVLAVDASGSINTEEFTLEREGTADAFADPEAIKAIQSGALGRIAVTMFDFSSPEYGKVVIDWQIVKDKASAEAFAALVREARRSPGRRTSVSNALELGSLLIESSAGEIHATRNVIDVSGDGPNNDGNPMQEAHDKVISKGIVVNGLPVMDDNANGYYPDLDKYYAGCVVGGRGAFVIVVRKYSDFMAAMRHKLILEVSQDENQIRQAMNELQGEGLMKKIAAADAGPNAQPQVMRPTTGYPGGCDIQGGFGGFGRFRF